MSVGTNHSTDSLALADLLLRASVEAFQNREIALLQDGRYDEWLELVTEDIRYWMPVVSVRASREAMVGQDGELAWFDDTLETLRLRVERLKTGLAVEESVPSRTRYFVQNLEITATADRSEARVVSNYLVYRTRREKQENYFVGGREDLLRQVNGEWKLAHRKMILDRNVLAPNTHPNIFL
jgi:3-phenylpropionate/cinnamic acid dioxygenase small subunit